MIPFDFEYYKPDTITEAIQTFQDIESQGKKVIYYSGGTEFITFSRINKLSADAVIDLKGIPECQVLGSLGEMLVFGSAISLNKITQSNLFPLLGQAVKQIADHTSRNKITIGGNLHSRLIYREGVLPLLLADAQVKIAGKDGEQLVELKDIFQQEMKLESGQFLVQILVEKAYSAYQYVSLKKTKASKVGYPVVSLAAIAKDNQIRAAFSGVCAYPFRSTRMEAALNDSSFPIEKRIDHSVSCLPAPIIDDIQASSDYRKFVLINALNDTMDALKGAIS
ncbi:FAD binding domain-containing protein [Neobacillus sp. NPDC058068]|uniref:FAD binding domain-containing protein n=1 Tax=Neobacillus sp. NPDC058068 TaxID=3346325 RepID=UPI0036DD783E